MIANKTKAALQGRQCHYIEQNPNQTITLIDQVKNPKRVAYSQLGISLAGGTPPVAEFDGVTGNPVLAYTPGGSHSAKNFVQRTYPKNLGDVHSPKNLDQRHYESFVVQPFGSNFSVFFQQTCDMFEMILQPAFSGEFIFVYSEPKGVAIFGFMKFHKYFIVIILFFNRAFLSCEMLPNLLACYLNCLVLGFDIVFAGCHHSIPLVISLACLRWRRLISPLAAVTRKPAVLSPSSFSCSISSITSCGIRTVVICDFAFFAPVAIAGAPYIRCMSVYAKIMIRKGLKCISLEYSVKCIGEIHLASAKPGSVGTLTGPLTKPLYEVTIMATVKSTRTRSKFTFLFLATHFNGGKPTVLRIEADTEAEARLKIECTDFTLVFAAQIRTDSPLQFHRVDLDSGRIEFIHSRYQASLEVNHV